MFVMFNAKLRLWRIALAGLRLWMAMNQLSYRRFLSDHQLHLWSIIYICLVFVLLNIYISSIE